MPLKALIFDVDGTLAETEEAHRIAFNTTFAELGLDWHWDKALYRHLLSVTGGKERMGFYLDEQNYPADGPIRGQIPDIHAAKTRHYSQLVSSGAIEPKPGVVRLMGEAIGAGVTVAIATTTSLSNVMTLLEAGFPAEIVSAIKVIGAAESVSKKKPAPDVYEWVIRELGVSATECAALEDSRNGLVSALDAGIPVVVVTPGMYTDDQDFSGAASVVSDLGEPGAAYSHIAGFGPDHSHVSLGQLQRLFAQETPA